MNLPKRKQKEIDKLIKSNVYTGKLTSLIQNEIQFFPSSRIVNITVRPTKMRQNATK